MLIDAEPFNALRRRIRVALEMLDAGLIQAKPECRPPLVPNYIDVNGGTFPGLEPEMLCWLVKTMQAVTDLPLCLDSPDPAALAAARQRV